MAFTSTNGRTQTALADINVTPLVDVVLVLLIIFMVTAPVLQSGIEVTVPKTKVVKEISEDGRPAFYEKNADAIVDRIVPLLKERDIVAVFSNGGFDNIHEKLLARLRT